LRNEETQPLSNLRESKLMVKCFLNYCKHHGDEVDVLFQMLSIFTIRTTIDYSFLKDYYLHTIAEVPENRSLPSSRFHCHLHGWLVGWL
jgi:transformation/transcription domain-associated protein